MAREANAAGLDFDVPLLSHYIGSGSDPIRHNPLNLMYRVDNLILKPRAKAFTGGRRRLTHERALSLRIASSAIHHFQEEGYEPANLAAFSKATNGFDGIVEKVTALPEGDLDLSFLGSAPVTTLPDAIVKE
jgi:hypothetical protein